MGIELAVKKETLELLIRREITKALRARPMKRTVQKYLGDMVRERMKKKSIELQRELKTIFW